MDKIPSIDVYEIVQSMKRRKKDYDNEIVRLKAMSECTQREIENIEHELELYLKQYNKKPSN